MMLPKPAMKSIHGLLASAMRLPAAMPSTISTRAAEMPNLIEMRDPANASPIQRAATSHVSAVVGRVHKACMGDAPSRRERIRSHRPQAAVQLRGAGRTPPPPAWLARSAARSFAVRRRIGRDLTCDLMVTYNDPHGRGVQGPCGPDQTEVAGPAPQARWSDAQRA